jgi:hypothetical protein
MKKNKQESEIKKAYKEILREAKRHSYLWQDSSLWEDKKDKEFCIFWGWWAQDETYRINFGIINGEFNFISHRYSSNYGPISLEEITDYMTEHKIPADKLRENFYDELKKPLSEYLANKYFSENKPSKKNTEE